MAEELGGFGGPKRNTELTAATLSALIIFIRPEGLRRRMMDRWIRTAPTYRV